MRMRDLMAQGRQRFRYEPLQRRVRGFRGDEAIIDTTRAALVWEPRRICPVYAVPADEIRAELVPGTRRADDVPGLLHPGIPFSVHTAAGTPVSIGSADAFRLDDLPGYVAIDFDAFDWWEEDETVRGHPRDPFHRVDVQRTSRVVRIERDGVVVAESPRARLVFETGLPTRYYLPRDDLRVDLRLTDRHTYCPYKGEASYFSFAGAENLIWSYQQPLPDMLPLAGLLGFWDEHFDIFVDGSRPESTG